MEPLTRRSFIKTTLVGASAAGFKPNSYSQSALKPLENIVDCHFHLWARDKKRFPYIPNPRYAPDYATTPEQWNADRVGAGVYKGIFVSGAPYGDNHSYLYHCLEKSPDSIRGVCLINPNTSESVRELGRAVEGRNIVGVRLQTSWLWGIDWESPHLAAFWRELGKMKLVAQVHLEPEFNGQLLKTVERYPETKVVIDHLGRPRNGNGADFMLLREVAQFPHVFIKLSSFASEADEGPPFLKIQPVVKELVEWFSPNRAVWGGSYKGGMGSAAYLQQINQARRLLDFLSQSEQEEIFCKAPFRLYDNL